MIAKLRGQVDSQGDDWVVVDVGGVGYLVFASAKTLARLPRVGAAVTLLIETHVREDHIHLYGFSDTVERSWFRLLLTVQGVGSKVALALLSTLSPDDLQMAIAAADKAMLARAQGVGPRLATRLIGELKEKAAAMGASRAVQAEPVGGISVGAGPLDDALSALVNLGYRRIEAHGALMRARATLGADAATAALIRAALRDLGREEVS